MQTVVVIILVLALNLMVANLIERYFSYDLEEAIYQQHNQYLLEVKHQVNEKIQRTPNTQWQDLTLQFEAQYDAIGTLLTRTPSEIAPHIFEELQLSQSQQGFIDIDMATLYYPLDPDTVLQLGPIPFESNLVLFTDYLPWLSAFLLNALLFLLFLKWHQGLQRRAIALLHKLSVDLSDKDDWRSSLKKVQHHMDKMQDENQQRLVLQRDLLHGVAHEFRSPMARIQFALDMLEDADADEQAQLQQSMHSALTDLDALVKELLYYARLKDATTNLANSSFYLDDVILTAIERIQPFYPRIRFDYTAAPQLILFADQNLIQRALINLLRNGGRFANTRCRIKTAILHQTIKITIEDDGMGIPPGKSERIFEPFTRLDPSRSRDSGGCGLGLAIVASIVTKHGGQITLMEHQDNEDILSGACFEIELPKKNDKQ